MNTLKFAKILVVALGVIIVILLAVLLFYKPVKGPTVLAVSADKHLSVGTPYEGETIVSPLTAKGTMTGGGWFFENVMPVTVLDGDGREIGGDQAHTDVSGDWMSTGTVSWSATVTFSAPKYATGTVVFKKDNPSGLPQNDAELRIPVRFMK